MSPAKSFVLHKTAGDKAATMGHLSDALERYQEALDAKWDPFVSGRMGEIFLELRDFALAAQYLQRAFTDPQGLSDAARDRFSKKLQRAVREVCRVDFVVDPVETRVVIDGFERSKGQTQFWVYLNPGDHAIHASSDGFWPFDTVLTTGRGCRRTQILVLHPVDVDAPAEQRVGPIDRTRYTLPNHRQTPVNQGELRRFFLELGPSISFGMTPGDDTWPGVAVGGLGRFGWRSASFWDFGGELRIVWATNNSVPQVKKAAAWTLGVAPCAHHRSGPFACGLAYLAGGAANGGENMWAAFGFGPRVGNEFHPYDRLRIRLSLDIMVHLPEPHLGPGERRFWSGIPLNCSANVTVLKIF